MSTTHKEAARIVNERRLTRESAAAKRRRAGLPPLGRAKLAKIVRQIPKRRTCQPSDLLLSRLQAGLR